MKQDGSLDVMMEMNMTVLPDVEKKVADFFDQLIPIFEKYASEREKKISNRYTRRRKGKK